MAELTEEQIEFLDKVCFHRDHWKLNSNGEVDVYGGVFMAGMNLTEIPVKFGKVEVYFVCSRNNLTTLKNCPTYTEGLLYFSKNNLTEYFKNIKEEDFPHWDKLDWVDILREYPFLINISMKYMCKDNWYVILENIPQTKLYLE